MTTSCEAKPKKESEREIDDEEIATNQIASTAERHSVKHNNSLDSARPTGYNSPASHSLIKSHTRPPNSPNTTTHRIQPDPQAPQPAGPYRVAVDVEQRPLGPTATVQRRGSTSNQPRGELRTCLDEIKRLEQHAADKPGQEAGTQRGARVWGLPCVSMLSVSECEKVMKL